MDNRQSQDLENFVVHAIDDAIRQKHIKVYYQPVVRTINRSLCGLEALARWDDPERGLLSPACFIKTLEEHHLIHKLDMFIIRQVCAEMRERFKQGKNAVPVSFNLSRNDFMTCDVFSNVESTLKEYDIPRDMIRIEITESMMAEDAFHLSNEISKFQKAGYQVWMDDFGSGYSSLNLLKNFSFDEIKIDMEFLSSFTDKAKSILVAMIDMAKHIGIQTLAEGVETEEHFAFLKKNGCEKVQGYFFGKPMPLEETMSHCKAQGLNMETRSWQKYYDKIGTVDFTTDRPFALYEYDGQKFQLLHMNEQLLGVLQDAGTENMKLVDASINSKLSPLSAQFRALHNTLRDEDDFKPIDFAVRGRVLRLSAKRIAANGEKVVYQTEITNLTRNEEKKQQEKMDQTFRSMYLMYDAIYELNLEQNTISHVMKNGFYEMDELVHIDEMDLQQALWLSKKNLIYAKDQRYFDEWINMETLEERIQASGKGQITELFRTKEANGSYVWKTHRIMAIPGTYLKKCLYVIMSTALMNQKTLQRLSQNIGIVNESDTQKNSNLWLSIIDSHIANIFWKDKNRRFVGANKSFLDYYGFTDSAELIGKTDEDMMWHISEDSFRRDEIEVITKGVTSENKIGKCIIRGQQHTIMATKTPIYENGEIAGLLGYFIDLDQLMGGKSVGELKRTDDVTNLMNAYGMMEAFADFVSEWEGTKANFASVWISIREFGSSVETYGKKVSNEMLRQVGTIIEEEAGRIAVCGRIHGASFNIFMQFDDKEEVQDLVESISERMSDIHEVYGNSVTVYVDSNIEYCDEVPNIRDMMNLITKEVGNTEC